MVVTAIERDIRRCCAGIYYRESGGPLAAAGRQCGIDPAKSIPVWAVPVKLNGSEPAAQMLNGTVTLSDGPMETPGMCGVMVNAAPAGGGAAKDEQTKNLTLSVKMF